MNWINTYLDEYYHWLREKTFVQNEELTNWTVINTPFLGAFNDTIDIYALPQNNTILLSDNGETLSNLELQGVHIQGSRKRKELLDSILINYGIRNNNAELSVETSKEDFSQAKHNILSAILEINDLYVFSERNVLSVFKEDVRTYLDTLDLVYTADFIAKGTTGLEFNFDFQYARKNAEIVIKSFNVINKANLPNFLFAWNDIKPVREKISKKEVKAIAFINDSEREVNQKYLDALKAKNAEYILWSDRDVIEKLIKAA